MSVITSMIGGFGDSMQIVYLASRKKAEYEANARKARQETAADVALAQDRYRQIQAKDIASAGAGGVSEGRSVLDVLIDNAQQYSQYIQGIQYKGDVSAWGLSEGAKLALWTRKANLFMGFSKAASQGINAYDKYANERVEAPAPDRESWFSNERAISQDNQTWLEGGETGFGDSLNMGGSGMDWDS